MKPGPPLQHAELDISHASRGRLDRFDLCSLWNSSLRKLRDRDTDVQVDTGVQVDTDVQVAVPQQLTPVYLKHQEAFISYHQVKRKGRYLFPVQCLN